MSAAASRARRGGAAELIGGEGQGAVARFEARRATPSRVGATSCAPPAKLSGPRQQRRRLLASSGEGLQSMLARSVGALEETLEGRGSRLVRTLASRPACLAANSTAAGAGRRRQRHRGGAHRRPRRCAEGDDRRQVETLDAMLGGRRAESTTGSPITASVSTIPRVGASNSSTSGSPRTTNAFETIAERRLGAFDESVGLHRARIEDAAEQHVDDFDRRLAAHHEAFDAAARACVLGSSRTCSADMAPASTNARACRNARRPARRASRGDLRLDRRTTARVRHVRRPHRAFRRARPRQRRYARQPLGARHQALESAANGYLDKFDNRSAATARASKPSPARASRRSTASSAGITRVRRRRRSGTRQFDETLGGHGARSTRSPTNSVDALDQKLAAHQAALDAIAAADASTQFEDVARRPRARSTRSPRAANQPNSTAEARGTPRRVRRAAATRHLASSTRRSAATAPASRASAQRARRRTRQRLSVAQRCLRRAAARARLTDFEPRSAPIASASRRRPGSASASSRPPPPASGGDRRRGRRPRLGDRQRLAARHGVRSRPRSSSAAARRSPASTPRCRRSSGLIETKLTAIEDTVVNRGGELDERIGKRHEDLAACSPTGLITVDARSSERLRQLSASLEGLAQRSTKGSPRAVARSSRRSPRTRSTPPAPSARAAPR